MNTHGVLKFSHAESVSNFPVDIMPQDYNVMEILIFGNASL
jgi:hypothetical protein